MGNLAAMAEAAEADECSDVRGGYVFIVVLQDMRGYLRFAVQVLMTLALAVAERALVCRDARELRSMVRCKTV